MKSISVFGLGYVGAVLVACLADNGHKVTGVDVNSTKVDMINEGYSPVIEAGLNELLHKGVQAGRIQATSDTRLAVLESEISFICVGTPSNPNGSLNVSYVQRVCEDIGAALKDKPDYHTVILRSTMLPGSTEEIAIPAIEKTSG
ncbi:MAG: GDP-mannose dehydrogenase, partial [Chloroflexota bacterium]